MTGAAGWLLFACRTTYAIEVAEVIWRRGEELAALVDNLDDRKGGAAGEPPPVEGIEAPVIRPGRLSPAHLALPAAVPLITPGHRFAVEAEARAAGLASFPPLVDPTATVARTASLGEGSVVNAAAVIGAATRLGRFVHVNRSASLGHHNEIADFATLGPGCLLAGSVRLGRGAFVGAGAVCAPEVAVGANAVVGAGAVVVEDVAPGAVVVGNPARVLRRGEAGYGGVAVPEAAE